MIMYRKRYGYDRLIKRHDKVMYRKRYGYTRLIKQCSQVYIYI